MKVQFLIFALCWTNSDLYAQTTKKDITGNLEVRGASGELLEYHLLDLNGNFRPGNSLAKRIYKYDSLNYLIEERYFSTNGKLYQYSDGTAMKRYIWNSSKDVVIIENYDSLEKRTVDKSIGASIICYRYDSLRRVKDVIYCDKDSLRTNNKHGYSRVEFITSPTAIEMYYDSNDVLIKKLDDNLKYLVGLQLQSSSIPRWLRMAQQTNRVDGVNFKSLYYDLTLFDQNFQGVVQLSVTIARGDINEVKIVQSENVSDKVAEKTKDALMNAHFISLSTLEARPIEGQINVYFRTTLKDK